MAKNHVKARHYRFDNCGEIIIVKAMNKFQVRDFYKLSYRNVQKFCSALIFDEDRKIDVDLTKSEVENE